MMTTSSSDFSAFLSAGNEGGDAGMSSEAMDALIQETMGAEASEIMREANAMPSFDTSMLFSNMLAPISASAPSLTSQLQIPDANKAPVLAT